jgi:hypothetical protein
MKTPVFRQQFTTELDRRGMESRLQPVGRPAGPARRVQCGRARDRLKAGLHASAFRRRLISNNSDL